MKGDASIPAAFRGAGRAYNRIVTPRFHAPGARIGQTLALPDDEAAHLTRVLRLKPGAPIVVFDGRGNEFDAAVERAGKAEVLVRIDGPRSAPAVEPRVAVTLVQAVLKGDKMDDVVRDAVMMGVAAIQPVITTRAEVTLRSVRNGARRERWERIAVSSAKQSGRAVVPQVLEPIEFEELVEPGSIGSAFMLVEPSATDRVMPLAYLDAEPPGEAAIIIGPEGGWTPDEIDASSNVAHLVTLGSRTFRADAMAVIAMAALFTLWKEY
jgi:16S rRNA (uracil1498-N3)-methyltransferase